MTPDPVGSQFIVAAPDEQVGEKVQQPVSIMLSKHKKKEQQMSDNGASVCPIPQRTGFISSQHNNNKSILGKLMHSKQVDLLRLKLELESLKTEKAALVTINEDLRGTKTKQDEHIQKLTEALQRSSAKATKALGTIF